MPVCGVGAQEAGIGQAPLDGVLKEAGGRNRGCIGEGQGAFPGADDKRGARGPGDEGGLRVVAMEDDHQVVVLPADLAP